MKFTETKKAAFNTSKRFSLFYLGNGIYGDFADIKDNKTNLTVRVHENGFYSFDEGFTKEDKNALYEEFDKVFFRAAAGRKGGSVKSPAKRAAATANARKAAANPEVRAARSVRMKARWAEKKAQQ